MSFTMKKNKKIYVAGYRGLVGSAIARRLQKDGYENLLLRTSAELDLSDQQATAAFFAAEKPDYVFLAAAKVGGIQANNIYPAEFIYQNLAIQTNVLHQSYLNGVKKLLFLGSSCIYPRECPQPMKEEYLLTGPLEPTNEPYAIAKIAGIEMCWSYNRQYNTCFIPVMPTNLYGPNDNYNLETSHVLPALIRKFYLAKLAAAGDLEAIRKDQEKHGPIPASLKKSLGLNEELSALLPQPVVELWGTGSPKREFLYVDDLADACLYLMNHVEKISAAISPDRWLFNFGTGKDITIRELAGMIADIIGLQGEIIWDESKPDGTPQKLLDVSRLAELGWQSRFSLEEGIRATYASYIESAD
jgi:GDP-L-fucose synthase